MIRGIEGKTLVCHGGERIDYGPFEEIQYRRVSAFGTRVIKCKGM